MLAPRRRARDREERTGVDVWSGDSPLEAESGRLGLATLDRMADQRTAIVLFIGSPRAIVGRIVIMENSRSIERLAFEPHKAADYEPCN
jgi:hypothetical protein